MKALHNNETGAAVIEFAILLLLLIPLLFGIIEFGFLWGQTHYLSQAAREGARNGARIAVYDFHSDKISNLNTDVKTAVEASVKASLDNFQPYHKLGVDTILDEVALTSTTQLFGEDSKPALKVTVTVNSYMVWPPMLWQLLKLIPSTEGRHSEIKQLTESAVFTISGN